MSLVVESLPAFYDNYLFLLRVDSSNDVAVVDPGDASVIQDHLERNQLNLTDIFITHHHPDHIGGVKKLVAEYTPRVWGYGEESRIPCLNKKIADGDSFEWQGLPVTVTAVPGHTLGHIIFYFPKSHVAFVGDTLFHHGCGRMFEGQPDVFWQSLCKIRGLPEETMLYCAHEYTEDNLRFAVSLEPDNTKLQTIQNDIKALREKGAPTVPMSLKSQKGSNPFLRCDEEAFQMAMGMTGMSPSQVFKTIRERKDKFR